MYCTGCEIGWAGEATRDGGACGGDAAAARDVDHAAARCDLVEEVDVVADVAHVTTVTPPLPSPPTHSFASALSETPVTLYDDGEARVERPSVLLALPASSDLRPEFGEDGEAAVEAAL